MIKDEVKHHRKCLHRIGYDCNCHSIKTPPTIPKYNYNMNQTYKELKNELELKEQELKQIEAMCSYIATNYAIFVISHDEENKDSSEKSLIALRDNIIKEAYDKFSK